MGKRHHYIPRFLLRHFASRRDGEKAWVFQIWANGHREISIRDTGASKNFYGGAGSGLEDDLARIETRLASHVAEVLATGDASGHAEALSELVWLQVVRTQATRRRFADAMQAIIKPLCDPSVLHQYLWEIPNEEIAVMIQNELDQMLVGTEREDATPEERMQLVLFLRHQLSSQLESGEIPALIGNLYSALSSDKNALAASRNGQLKGLESLIVNGYLRVPEAFAPAEWRLLRFDTGDVVLGDVCVVADSEDAGSASLLRTGQDWRAVYLPLSSDAVAFAPRVAGAAPWPIEEINQASFELSDVHVFASAYSANIERLMPTLGSRRAVLTEDEAWELSSAEDRTTR